MGKFSPYRGLEKLKHWPAICSLSLRLGGHMLRVFALGALLFLSGCSLADDLKDMKKNTEEMNQKLSDMKSQLGDINGKLDSLNNQISDLNNEMQTLTQD